MRIPVQQCFRGQDLSVLTEAALRDLLVNPRLLDGVELAVSGESLEGDDFAFDGGSGRDARARGDTVDDHGAGAALAKSAAKMRPPQIEIVAQHIEQRR